MEKEICQSQGLPVVEKKQPETMEESFQEIKRLQRKVNLLIDHVEEMRKQITEAEIENLKLKKELEDSRWVKHDTDVSDMAAVGRLIKILGVQLQDSNRQLPFKNNTELAKEWVRVRKTDVDIVLRDVIEADKEELMIELLINLGIFRQGSRKGLFSVKDESIGKHVSAYFIRRSAVGVTDEWE